MYFVYILQSLLDGSFYIGYTENIEQRLWNHNNGHSKYTRSKLPWKVCYSETYTNKKQAIIREKQLKSWKSRKAISILISQKISQKL